MFKRILISIIPIILLLTTISNAENIITGKVIGVAGGDTITVLQDYTQHKIRLYGIDCPGSGQDFGNKAKKFTSGLVFNREGRVVQKDMDRYGRIVGMVYVDNVCVNEEILKAGFAWVYQKYCKEFFCDGWYDLEIQAKENRIGLWSHPDPVPPWEYRLLISKKNLTLFSEYFDLTGYFSDYFNRIRYAQLFNGFLRHGWAT